MSMAGKRYYGADVPRSTGPHPDPLEQMTELEMVRQDAATAWDKCEERRVENERLRNALQRIANGGTSVLISAVLDECPINPEVLEQIVKDATAALTSQQGAK